MSYEEDIQRMEEITSRLQDSSVPLDESIKLFEEGVLIARRVEKELTEIERKVEILISEPQEDAEHPVVVPFKTTE